MDIRDYICSISIICDSVKSESNPCGSGFFINKHCLVTARHMWKNSKGTDNTAVCIKYKNDTYTLNDCDLEFTDNYILMRFGQNIDDLPVFNEKVFNIAFFVEKECPVSWEAHGFLELSRSYHAIYGTYCQNGSDRNNYILSRIKMIDSDYKSMSGSPVVINNMIVGILQKQNTTLGVPNSLIFTTLDEIAKRLKPDTIQERVYNNKYIEKNDYRDLLEQNNPYIKRRVRFYEDDSLFADHPSLIELLESKALKREQGFYVIVGEAGSGKTVELKNLAAELHDDKYALYPVYVELRKLITNQRLEEVVPKYFEYLNDHVPVCLILDGYDEIGDGNFRNNILPNMLSQHISNLKDSKECKEQSIIVVISSRINYYNKNRFDDFTALEILPLCSNDINPILQNECIDIRAFYDQIRRNDLSNIVTNPFYFWHIIRLFKQNDTLPPKDELMINIINLLMERNYEKYNGYINGITHKNRVSIDILKSIAAATFLIGQDFLSDDDFSELTDDVIDDKKSVLLQCTDILIHDDNGNYRFVHNIFREYLAAAFFNERYKDDLGGLIDLIAYSDQSGIQKEYYNVTSFLLRIRNSNDLLSWIAEHCLDDYELFLDECDEQTKYKIFIQFFESYNLKCQVFFFDSQSFLGKAVNSEEGIDYLLDTIYTTSKETVLYNSLRILQYANVPPYCKEVLKKAVISFLQSDKGNENHKRDAITVLAYQKIFDPETVNFLINQYSQCEDEQILRGIYIYVDELQLYDRFVDFLICGIRLSCKWDNFPRTIIDSLKRITLEESFVKFLNFVINTNENTYQKIKHDLNPIIRDNEFITNLKRAYYNGNQQRIFDLVIEASCHTIRNLYFEGNLFSEFFNQTGTDADAIESFFKRYKTESFTFYELSRNLSCFFVFLKNGYMNSRFDDCIEMFDYCVRSIPRSDPHRQAFIELICDSDFPTKQKSLNYIESDSQYKQQTEEEINLFLKYVFDFELYKNDLMKFLKENELHDPTKNELRKITLDLHLWYDRKMLLYNMIRCFCSAERKVIDIIQKIATDSLWQDLWIIVNIDNPPNSENDIKNLLSLESLLLIENICKKLLHEYEPEKKITYIGGLHIEFAAIKNVLSIIKRFNFNVEDTDLDKLVYIPASLYCNDPNEYKNGFSDWLINKIGKKRLLRQINNYLKNDLIHGDFLDICLQFFTSENIYSNELAQLAIEKIKGNDTEYGMYYSWNYLIKNNQQKWIIHCIKQKEISDYTLISNLALMHDYKDDDLLAIVSDLFDRLYVYYEQDNSAGAIIEFPFLKSDYTNLLRCLKDTISYLIQNGSTKHIKLYLNQMIESQKLSPFENSEFHLLITYVNSTEYIDQLIKIMILKSKGCFCKDEFSGIHFVFSKVMVRIGCKDPQKMLNALKPYAESDDNEDLCRMANNILEQIRINTLKANSKHLSLYETKEIVF